MFKKLPTHFCYSEGYLDSHPESFHILSQHCFRPGLITLCDSQNCDEEHFMGIVSIPPKKRRTDRTCFLCQYSKPLETDAFQLAECGRVYTNFSKHKEELFAFNSNAPRMDGMYVAEQSIKYWKKRKQKYFHLWKKISKLSRVECGFDYKRLKVLMVCFFLTKPSLHDALLCR
ncbi:unnamed protein product [Cylicocyclus nassatus]|uniref:Uncharacterized protein n=1 Tax=Cylicocyclus nassatus TaxID=53992 RepID=A0AA36GMZ8_CYLNA|nr:unnamed protein product [Cylicocyclus nassatus]